VSLSEKAGQGRQILLMDPMTGEVGTAAVRARPDRSVEVYLQLRAGASIVLRSPRDAARTAGWSYLRSIGEPQPVRGRWLLEFVAGGPDLPAPVEMERLESFAELGGGAAAAFAGTARYSIRFDVAAAADSTFVLDLGRVAESARVRLNGRDLGRSIRPPHRFEAPGLRPRGNDLEVEVTNLTANRIRDLDRRGVVWRVFEDINFVNQDYRPFDASGWPVRASGLLGPVRLVPVTRFRPDE
jgi:hypothetical protein